MFIIYLSFPFSASYTRRNLGAVNFNASLRNVWNDFIKGVCWGDLNIVDRKWRSMGHYSLIYCVSVQTLVALILSFKKDIGGLWDSGYTLSFNPTRGDHVPVRPRKIKTFLLFIFLKIRGAASMTFQEICKYTMVDEKNMQL